MWLLLNPRASPSLCVLRKSSDAPREGCALTPPAGRGNSRQALLPGCSLSGAAAVTVCVALRPGIRVSVQVSADPVSCGSRPCSGDRLPGGQLSEEDGARLGPFIEPLAPRSPADVRGGLLIAQQPMGGGLPPSSPTSGEAAGGRACPPLRRSRPLLMCPSRRPLSADVRAAN